MKWLLAVVVSLFVADACLSHDEDPPSPPPEPEPRCVWWWDYVADEWRKTCI